MDPGLRGCGVGVVERVAPQGLHVVAAAYVRSPDDCNRDCRAWVALGHEVDVWLAGVLPPGADALVVVEEMQVYEPGPGNDVPPSDLLQVQGVSSSVATYAALRVGRARVRTVLPRVWKGQVPKDVYIRTRIKPRLAVDDFARVQLPTSEKLQKDVWDGLGLAMYGLDRISRTAGAG